MPFVQRVIEPKYLSSSSLFDAEGKPRVSDDELLAVTNSTLSNALRQLASLALAANDIFVELTKQLHSVGQRSDALKGKIGALEEKVVAFDPKKVAVPVSDICTFALKKDHYAAKHDLDTNLFGASSRPSALQTLYEAAAKTPIPLMRQMDRWRRDGQRSSRFFVCTPVLGAKRRKIRSKIDIDIETRMPASVGELRRWTSSEALGDITVAPECPNRIAPNVTFTDGNATDGTIGSDDEAIDHKLPSPEEQVQVIALKFPAEVVAVDISGRAFNRMCVQRRSLLHNDVSVQTEEGSSTLRTKPRTRKPRNRRRNTLAGTDQKEIQNALISGEEPSSSVTSPLESPEAGNFTRSKSSEPLRTKKDSSLEIKKSHFQTLKQWGKNRLKLIKSQDSSAHKPMNINDKLDEDDLNIYETVTVKRKRSLNRDKRLMHERKPSYSSSEKSSINLPITTPLSAAMSIAVKLRESSVQRRLRRSGGNKDEPHSSSGNWSASSESGRASIGSEITSTTQPKSTTSAATSSNSLNQHPPSSVNSRRKFNINNSGSSSITSEGTLTPDIHDFHEDGETSSVYSCDTEGYYTSFHMDSGLKTLKEEDGPVTPLHSTTAFSNSSSSNTVLTAENEYELFGKGSTSTTASSAGTVCTTLKATGSSRSLALGPAVPERKSSLSKSGNKENTPGSSLEREFASEKTGTVKRSPASSKSTVVAMIHQQTDGDVSPDSGHNTSSSPIESANSPNGVRSGSEFEFSECSDMEGPDRIERIRVKTTINSSRIPSMCVITPPHSDDESVKSQKTQGHSYKEWKQAKSKLLETDLDNFEFADSEFDDFRNRVVLPSNGNSRLQLINVNPQSGYATIETINILNNEKSDINENKIKTFTNVRAPSPSGGTVIVKEVIKQQTQPIIKGSLLPFNSVFDKIKSNFSFTKKESKTGSATKVKELDLGDYVTIADVKNNNEKTSIQQHKKVQETEYVSLNELPCNMVEDSENFSPSNDSLERKRRQGARVTLNAEGKVVYTSDSLRRRKGAHTTFEPGPYVKEVTAPLESPVSAHRIPKTIRPVQSTQDSRPLSPQLGKVVIRASSGTTSEIVRVPSATIVAAASNISRPISPKPNNARGAYVNMQDTKGSLSPSREKEPVYSPSDQPKGCNQNWVVGDSPRRFDVPDSYGYNNPLIETNMISLIDNNHLYSKGNTMYRTLPCRKSLMMSESYAFERPITPDIMKGLPSNNFNLNPRTSRNLAELPPRQYAAQKLGIPVQIPQIYDYKPQVPSSNFKPTNYASQFHLESSYAHEDRLNDSLKISPIDPRNEGEFQSSTPSSKSRDLKAAVNLESKLLSPKKTTMSTEELYAVIHKGKKKLNIQSNESPTKSIDKLSPKRCKTPDMKSKTPETGYIGDKARSRFSWSPSDGEFVEYNTNIDKLSPGNDTSLKQSWACNDRKPNQHTSRLDFKKLLLQHSVKATATSPGNKKLSAVEQLKISKQMNLAKSNQNDMSILELSGSPKGLHNRRFSSGTPGSPKAGDKQRAVSKLLSPRSQWRFTNPRTDVLSSTIPEDCGEDESPSSSVRRKAVFNDSIKHEDQHLKQNSSSELFKSKQAFMSAPSKSSPTLAQRLRAQRTHFFNSSLKNDGDSASKKEKTCLIPTLETAF